MKAKLRQVAVELRVRKRLSYSAIQRKLGVARSTLSYWLREHPLEEKEIAKLRRSTWLKGEASRERFRVSMREKRERTEEAMYHDQRKKLANVKKESIFVAGLMLYLGEGDKKNRARVGLANTDPQVIQFFIKWLEDILGVEKCKMHIELHLYENMNIEKEEKFWRKITGMPKNQYYKTQIKKIHSGSLAYQGQQRHGTCSIIFNSVEKKREIMMAIKAFLDLY